MKKVQNWCSVLLISMPLMLFSSIAQATTAAGTPQLTYSYSVPYSGAGTITVNNYSTTNTVTLSQFNFVTNTTITGTPYGTLWSWQSTLKATPDKDGVDTDFTINIQPNVTIPVATSPTNPGSVTLTYQIGTISGPFSPYNLAMSPENVTAVLAGGSTPVTININGMCTGVACNDPGNGKRIMGYYPNWAYWRDPKFMASQLPFDKVNEIGYAFSIFDSNGNISLYDQDSDPVNIPSIAQARQQYPYLNASLSFGGWSWASTPAGWSCQTGASPNGPAACFSKMAANPTATAAFVANVVKAMKEVHFNGIDIDWEYPLPADAVNYVNLLQGLRTALDAQGKLDNTHYYLTVAVGAGIDKINYLTAQQWQAVANAVDYVDVMTYDFHGNWDYPTVPTDFMSAMSLDPKNDPTYNNPTLGKYDVTDAINAYVDAGVPGSKIVVGIPVYGRAANINSVGNTEGLYQTMSSATPPMGEWDNQQSGPTGMWDYKCIVDKTACGGQNISSLPKLTLVDPTQNPLGQYSQTPWGYASNYFITYDDANSATYKANWIKSKALAGVMLWDFTGDFADNDSRSIVYAVQQVFGSSAQTK